MTEGKTWGRYAVGNAPRLAAPAPMHLSLNRWLPRALVAAACVLLVGCSESQVVSPDAESGALQPGSPVAASSPPVAASPVPSLSEVVWATSADPVTNAPRDEVASYPPDAPRIAAFVLTGALPAGSTVQAEWEYNDTTLDAFARQIVLPAAADRTWLSFHIDRDEAAAWPAGVYEVSISLNGQSARHASVEVGAPE